jgi:hypothetical protein
MYELLFMFPALVNTESKTINTLHVAEAPGNFIMATEYFINKFHPSAKHNWKGNSLNPHNKHNQKVFNQFIFGDDGYGLIKNHRDKWLFGKPPNDTGDISDPSIIKYIADSYTDDNKPFLITSDAGLSMDEGGTYNRQEDELSKIVLGVVITALATLQVGGNFVYKAWMPMRLPSSLSTLYLLFCYFDIVHITKPLNSRPANAEIYILCAKDIKDYLIVC